MGVRRREASGRHAGPRAAVAEKPHPALAKLATALREYKQAVEREVATADILRALARSSTDPQPVFDAIVEHAHRLCGAVFSVVYRYDGALIHVVADKQVSARSSQLLRSLYPMAPRRDHIIGRCVLEGRPVHSADVPNDRRFPANRQKRNAFSKALYYRAGFAVPLLRNDAVVGAIAVARLEPRPFTKKEIRLVQTFADQAVIAMENVRLFNETREALEHQKASADILRIVAGSVESTDPVFEAITAAGKRLIPNSRVALILVRDGKLHYASHSGVSEERRAALAKLFPMPLDRGFVAGATVLGGRTIHIPDSKSVSARFKRSVEVAKISGYRAMLSVPLIYGDKAIGVIAVSRESPGAFSDKQIALVKTFADQAVIAIRNASFFREIQERNAELKQSLEFQGATSEILASISSSIAETQPVFDAIVRNLRSLFGNGYAAVFLVREGRIDVGAVQGDVDWEKFREIYPLPLDERTAMGQAMLRREVVHYTPVRGNPAVPPLTQEISQKYPFNSMLCAPMTREGKVIGGIAVTRRDAVPFDDKHIALIKAFADQAVIAIENARLFNETKEALERQTATGEILASISGSITDTQPVFDAIVRNVLRLLGTRYAAVQLVRDGQLHLAGFSGEPGFERIAAAFPLPLDADSLSGQAIQSCKVAQLAPVIGNPDVPQRSEKLAREFGYNALIAAPMIREGRVIGVIGTGRQSSERFDDKQVALIKTFADQAVIAIENVRLFNETKEALERQTATSEILGVISRSPADVRPVFEVIVTTAKRLLSCARAIVLLRSGDHFDAVVAARAEGLAAPIALAPVPIDPAANFPSRVFLEKRALHLPDWSTIELPPHEQRIRASGVEASLMVPLRRDADCFGVLVFVRAAPVAFTDNEIALAESFADQAVIALENTRLFNETKEALERQTATAEILEVMSRSPADAQPVFDAVAQKAARLCDATVAAVTRFDGELVHLAATCYLEPGADAAIRSAFPAPPSSRGVTSRAILERRIVHLPDVTADEEYRPGGLADAASVRSVVVVPMLRSDRPLGAITVCRGPEPRPFSDRHVALLKTFADQAVIAIENARLFNETKEALERQTATSEVLGVISSSPSDVTPVYRTILGNVTRLCEANIAALFLYDGEYLKCVAHNNVSPEFAAHLDRSRLKPSRETSTRLAALERRVVHVEDYLNDPAFSPSELHRREGGRTILSVPMLREGALVGVITVWRREPRRFSEPQVALVKTFADQGVIAIENVRLFNETKEALEQQTAISEVLRVISSSPTDVKPVLDAVVSRSARICEASDARIFLLDGQLLRHVAGFGDVPLTVQEIPLSRASATGRSAIDGIAVHIPDIEAESAEEYSVGKQNAAQTGWRTVLSVPLKREDRALGAIVLRRIEVRPFSEKQITLLKTFADQAAIAIENVRLFKETEEALEQQTATAEILRVISSSPTDTGPVLDAIVQSAARLFSPRSAAVVMRDSGQMVLRAVAGPLASGPKLDALRKLFPIPYDINRYSAARAIAECRIVEIADAQGAGAPEQGVKVAKAMGYRSLTLVPLVREGVGIGLIALIHPEPGYKLEAKQLELVKTFADQAVIAIENARLFNETKEALEQQTATAEILRVISSSPADIQPVFDSILEHAMRLCDAGLGTVGLYDGKNYQHVAQRGGRPEYVKWLFSGPFEPKPAYTIGRMIAERKPFHAPDYRELPDYRDGSPRAVATAELGGARTYLAVPMLKEGRVVGGITIRRSEVRPFTQKQIDLLSTFANQAVIAIENVRLFNETEEALKRQTATAEVLKLISRTTFELEKVLQALLDNAARLSGARQAVMLRPDAADNYLPAFAFNWDEAVLERLRQRPIRPGRDSINGRVLLERRPIHVPDVRADPQYGRHDLVELGGFRSVLSVPMLRDGEAIGLISLTGTTPFTDKQMEVVTTFADQAVIAIENVRLFKEIEEKSAQLEVANKHKSDFLANMSHELRTPLNAIIGFSEVLMEKMFGEVNEKQGEYLKDIHESGKHLLSLINDILDLSKIEAGRMELDLAAFHLPTAISNAMTLIRERAQRHGIELGLEVDPQLGEFQADERKVKQILLNLLSNAVKFTPEGGRVDVSARQFDGKVEVAVRDTGIGIAPEDQAAVFEEFKQVGSDAARKAQGTGLGLALTRRFVELHGGEIRVESAPGKGSTFRFTLPVRHGA